MERAFIGKHPASGREVRKPLVRVGVRLQGSGPSVRVCSEAGGRAEARPALKLETHPGQISSGARGPGRFTFEVNTARGVQEVGHPGVHGGSGLRQLVHRPLGLGSSSRTCSPAPCSFEPLTLPLGGVMGSRPLPGSAASPWARAERSSRAHFMAAQEPQAVDRPHGPGFPSMDTPTLFGQSLEVNTAHWSPSTSVTMKCAPPKKVCSRDFPNGPVVKTSPSNAGGAGSIPGWGAEIAHASWPKNQSIKQEQYCNKFNKDFKKMVHVKKIFKKKKKCAQAPQLISLTPRSHLHMGPPGPICQVPSSGHLPPRLP